MSSEQLDPPFSLNDLNSNSIAFDGNDLRGRPFRRPPTAAPGDQAGFRGRRDLVTDERWVIWLVARLVSAVICESPEINAHESATKHQPTT